MSDILPNGRERTGLVDEGADIRARYGKFIDRTVRAATVEVNRRVAQILTEEINRRVQAEVDAIVAARKIQMDREAEAAAGNLYLPVETIIAAVTAATGQTFSDLQSPRRMRNMAYPRHLAMHLIKVLRPDYSLPMIGRLLKKDHTTVMHGLRMIEIRRSTPPFPEWFEHPAIKALFAPAEETAG